MSKTTAADLERLWKDYTNETVFDERNFHSYPAGTITKFDCNQDCSSVSFTQGGSVIMKKKGPGSMSNVPSDIGISASHGGTKGLHWKDDNERYNRQALERRIIEQIEFRRHKG
ncbi:hypothetical protein FocnCong_v010007 [Fusarium oxysporum f. sp. conglutinans]|nr:hypothetical protein FocnCong_v010007 [Fusarium oxysporum f. sp. conglutinans]